MDYIGNRDSFRKSPSELVMAKCSFHAEFSHVAQGSAPRRLPLVCSEMELELEEHVISFIPSRGKQSSPVCSLRPDVHLGSL